MTCDHDHCHRINLGFCDLKAPACEQCKHPVSIGIAHIKKSCGIVYVSWVCLPCLYLCDGTDFVPIEQTNLGTRRREYGLSPR